MAQETISSAILIIAAIIATVALVNAIYPSLFRTTDTVGSVSDAANNRVNTELKVAMTGQPNAESLSAWVKNVGSAEIPAARMAYTDVYFGDPGSMARADTSATAAYRWSYTLDDVDSDGNWGPGETVRFLITDEGASHLTAGTHDLKIVLYNSASAEAAVTI